MLSILKKNEAMAVYRFFQQIKVLCFWGTLYLLFLMIGFGVSLEDLRTEAFNVMNPVKIVSIYLLISPILYSIIAIGQFIYARKQGQFVFSHIGSSLLPNFWPIYKGFDFRGSDWSNKAYHIVGTILWWGIVAFCNWSVYTQKGNLIITKISKYNDNEILIRSAIFICICGVIYIISQVLMHIVFKQLREDMKYF